MNPIRENLAEITGRITRAAEKAGRDPGAVKLIVITKGVESGRIHEVLESGANEIGENRVKEAALKNGQLGRRAVAWHMVGHLQSNKAREAVKLFSVIHSVDTVKLAAALDKEAGKINKVQNILAEVNASGEESKFGLAPDAVEGFLKDTKDLKHVKVLGLMTMAPFTRNAEDTRPYFRKLKTLASRHGLRELSMGMTQDFEIAVEEGATMVRVGRAIFERGVL